MLDEISFLVKETFKDVEKLAQDKTDFSAFEGLGPVTPDEVPGFFYHLQKKTSTFVLRIYPSENLGREYHDILMNPQQYPSLRLDEGEGALDSRLDFFECDRVEIARNIHQHLGNKRFPIFEERVFNISDPGDSWWLKTTGDSMVVFFKLSCTENLEQLTKLGPLGESQKFMEIFNQLYGYFKMIFPVSAYSSAHGQWSVSCLEKENENFQALKELFISGDPSHCLWDYLRKLEYDSQDGPYLASIQKANYLLMELACMRNFWKTIQERLNKSH